jgi:hypothetical protein
LLRCYKLEFEINSVVCRVTRLYHLLIEPGISCIRRLGGDLS